jgi:prepilin peptidase CpaA
VIKSVVLLQALRFVALRELSMLQALVFVVFPFCMVFAALSDMLSMTIANRVSLLLVGVFAVVAPLTGMSWAAYGGHFAAGGLVLAVTFSLFAFGGMGGGDAKLLSATAVWMGLNLGLVEYLVVSTFIGGALTLAIVVYRNSALAVYTGHNPFLRNLADSKTGVPYGIALGMGGLLTYPASPMMVWALQSIAAQ